MAGELIRLDDKHISVEQIKMNYLRGVGFWHVATVGRGCKLDPKLISALIESVLSLWKMSICNWDCRWTGTQSPGLFNLVIGERYATSFWALFRRILTEVGSRWAGYETHFRIRMMIQPN
ncbi:hypothetical protein Gotur_022049 [Gossypium turneri]